MFHFKDFYLLHLFTFASSFGCSSLSFTPLLPHLSYQISLHSCPHLAFIFTWVLPRPTEGMHPSFYEACGFVFLGGVVFLFCFVFDLQNLLMCWKWHFLNKWVSLLLHGKSIKESSPKAGSHRTVVGAPRLGSGGRWGLNTWLWLNFRGKVSGCINIRQFGALISQAWC